MRETFLIDKECDDADKVVGEILRKLRHQFPQAVAIDEYCQFSLTPGYSTFSACAKNGDKVGFAMLVMNSSKTAEVWVMGVLPKFHRLGIGSALLARLEDEASKNGARYIMVKTIGPSQNDPSFLKSFDFYRTNGYDMLVEAQYIWKDSYCAILIKTLNTPKSKHGTLAASL